MTQRPAMIVLASLVLLLVSVGSNVMQAKRITALLSAETLVGRAVPLVSGIDVAGRPVTLPAAAAVPTLYYYFSPTCGWCERNWRNIETLVREQGSRYRIVGLSSSPIDAAYLAERRTTLPVVGRLAGQVQVAFGFRGTPHTVVVSSDGIITHDWPGAFTPKLQRRIEDVFQLTLPGLTRPTD